MEFWQEWGWVLTVSSPVPVNKYLWNYDFCVFPANWKFGLLYPKKKKWRQTSAENIHQKAAGRP